MTPLIFALFLNAAHANEAKRPEPAPTRGREAPPHKKALPRPPVDVPTPEPTKPDPVR